MNVGNKKLKLQTDTVAAQSLLSYKTCRQMETVKLLHTAPDHKLQSHTRNPIEVNGHVSLLMKYKTKTVNVQYHAVDLGQ